LPEDDTIPSLKGWRICAYTWSCARAHISLFRDEDKTLIAGDAFVTTDQQSAIAVMFQTKKLQGPPTYFTYDWDAANESVEEIIDPCSRSCCNRSWPPYVWRGNEK
jgi:hypothetical protein